MVNSSTLFSAKLIEEKVKNITDEKSINNQVTETMKEDELKNITSKKSTNKQVTETKKEDEIVDKQSSNNDVNMVSGMAACCYEFLHKMENQVTTSTNKNSYTCHICQEIGSSDHPTRSCPSLTCHECGRSGHAKKHCPKLLVCTKCAQKGHEKKNCPRSKICGKCGQDGHLSIDCKISEDSDDEIEVIIPPPKPAPVVVDLPVCFIFCKFFSNNIILCRNFTKFLILF